VADFYCVEGADRYAELDSIDEEVEGCRGFEVWNVPGLKQRYVIARNDQPLDPSLL
jgi:hypothetical protein